jgi:hypothetical protein
MSGNQKGYKPESLVKIYQYGDRYVEVRVFPTTVVHNEKLSPPAENGFWCQAIAKTIDGEVLGGLPIVDTNGRYMTYKTKDDALEAAIKYFGL